MKRFITILLVIVLVFGVGVFGASCKDTPDGQILVGSDFIAEQKAYVKWEGRYDYTQGEGSNPSKINLYHTASGFTVDFVGSALYVEFDCTISGNSEKKRPYYNVGVDGELMPTTSEDRTFYLSGGRERVTIVDGLEFGNHTVTCLKMSEPYDALTSIVSMETDGEFIERDVEYDKGNFKFMFVCASGGSGHGSLGFSDDGGSLGRTTRNSSSLHSFNYLTARIFGADVQYVGNSGWGVSFPSSQSVFDVLDYSGITTSNNVNGAKTTALWDYNKWIPDVIIFNIGGNDTTASGFNKATYQSEVVQMVKKLHEKYPNAYMVWTHTESNAGRYAVSAMTDAGIMKEDYMAVAIIPKVGVNYNDEVMGVGANGHNSLKSHIVSADIIANTLCDKWGFMKLNQNIKFSDYKRVLQMF